MDIEISYDRQESGRHEGRVRAKLYNIDKRDLFDAFVELVQEDIKVLDELAYHEGVVEHLMNCREEYEYDVDVCRIGYGHETIRVKAHSHWEAERKAMEEAGNHVFSDKNSEYKTGGVHRLTTITPVDSGGSS